MGESVSRYGVLAPLSAGILFLNACAMPTENKKPNVPSSVALSVNFELQQAIAFLSTRDNPTGVGPGSTAERVFNAAEIYLVDPNCLQLSSVLGQATRTALSAGCPRRVTVNTVGDGFPALSPDGKKIVFDSNRLRAAGEPLNVSDLFIMDPNGENQTHLIRGSSGSWARNSKKIAYHASASGTGQPIKPDPGAATIDSDIFVLNVSFANSARRNVQGKTHGKDLLNGVEAATNITNNPLAVDDDPDWSPNGDTILFTSHLLTDSHSNSVTAEIYKINADGTGLLQLTHNAEEERGPSWSPNGTKIVFMCRSGTPVLVAGVLTPTFEICVMNADGTGHVQLTFNNMPDLTPTWSLDGRQIMFHRNVSGLFQLFVINLNADGTANGVPFQVSYPPGINAFPNWGEVRVDLRD
ncbi:MAG: hypothetical protein M3P26_16925 [Gemmatimonadota bacterium]|nr:hypothetical protein [Gemmatimonadota bacterium]